MTNRTLEVVRASATAGQRETEVAMDPETGCHGMTRKARPMGQGMREVGIYTDSSFWLRQLGE